ncbi:MAG: hypothetical protein WA133_04455 [Syntrophales bacterium]
MKNRLQRLYDSLRGGRLKVKVLPDEAFGLIHGKAGGIRGVAVHGCPQ